MKYTLKKAFVLFGPTSDLALRKIIPGLCTLFLHGSLVDCKVIACGRRQWGSTEYQSFIQSTLETFPPEVVRDFLEHVTYIQGELDNPAMYALLRKEVGAREAMYHIALHPEFYPRVVEMLGKAGLEGKLMLEKPFGEDMHSAEALEKVIEQYFSAKYVFRIDHYLAKKGLSDVATYRTEHPEFEARLNKDNLTSITYRILEHVDVHTRGNFYDTVGALRDVGQSHLLLMLAVSLMDLKKAEHSPSRARAEVLRQLTVGPPVPPAGTVRGQYEGYIDEPGVKKDSQTETYFRLVAHSSRPELEGVPLVLEAGKALKEKKIDITLQFADGSRQEFDITKAHTHGDYATLISAAMEGDASLFVGTEEVMESWKFTESIAKTLASTPLLIYKRGVEGLDIR